MGLNALWWWIDRWRKSTAYTDMTLEEQGAYRNLLDEANLRGGPLPNDERILAKACGDAIAWPRVRANVMARFELCDGFWRNLTLDKVLAESKRRAEKQSRYRNSKGNTTGNTLGNRRGSPSPYPSLVTNNQPTPAAALPALHREVAQVLAEESKASGIPADELLYQVSKTPTGKAFTRIDTQTSEPWLRTALERLIALRMERKAKESLTKAREPPVPEPDSPFVAWVSEHGGPDQVARMIARWLIDHRNGTRTTESERALLERWRTEAGAPQGVIGLVSNGIGRAERELRGGGSR